ncbi:ABC transporter substrate-binding protein [Sinorhizobium medicae]|uniref:ABC transporter substrate-binding protein n=2 Tax=Sinorhizobium medicae TaxID=110321 RepID=UPI001296FF62|nr:ABC transporter substrate-binding protein [Sinorhizobium medicae]MDX0967943.1 PhnD/SsuA/transferrin family substrate-binding protein [Sinorhizobium medicae]MQV49910.1 PhnD/SsuA/transferrin family substrate-binding protein [Sinorhizobium medicae]MQV57045.1 PhnD/SsuA/transferrin family substrate-binding protein [Sinorhizobium medicae]MQV71872.1 PhnD/SsuA/transferrin family substrate-binding protein [Sinorhizobium medicae]MQV75324.1 PhnD/SsuA/transferrin family substrate-binding protein [Sinor
MHQLITSTLLALSCLTSTVNAAENKPLTVAMTTWVGYGLLHLAQQKGFFNEQGVDVSLTTVQDKPATAAAIATGRLDGWATTVDTFIFYNAKKLGIKQVLAVDFSKGGEGIVAAGDIKTVADLKGRTLGAEEGSSTYFFVLNLFADSGINIKDVKLQSMRAGDAGAAFAAGRLDAAATWDPWLSKAKERGGHVLASSADKPGLIVDTVAFRADVIEKRPNEVKSFIKAYFEAYDYWKSSPADANAIMAKALGIKDDEFNSSLAGLEFVSREQNQEYIGTSTSAGQITSVTERGIEFYTQAGLLKEKFDAAAVVEVAPLDAALAK